MPRKYFWHNALMHRVGAGGYPAHAPLRTVRESFPSHGSSLSKDTPVRGVPAIFWFNVSILSLVIPLLAELDQLFCRAMSATQSSGVSQNTRRSEGHKGWSLL